MTKYYRLSDKRFQRHFKAMVLTTFRQYMAGFNSTKQTSHSLTLLNPVMEMLT